MKSGLNATDIVSHHVCLYIFSRVNLVEELFLDFNDTGCFLKPFMF